MLISKFLPIMSVYRLRQQIIFRGRCVTIPQEVQHENYLYSHHKNLTFKTFSVQRILRWQLFVDQFDCELRVEVAVTRRLNVEVVLLNILVAYNVLHTAAVCLCMRQCNQERHREEPYHERQSASSRFLRNRTRDL